MKSHTDTRRKPNQNGKKGVIENIEHDYFHVIFKNANLSTQHNHPNLIIRHDNVSCWTRFNCIIIIYTWQQSRQPGILWV